VWRFELHKYFASVSFKSGRSTRLSSMLGSSNKLTNICITIFTQIVAQGYYYFLSKNKDKTLQIVSHCDIIWGCATIKFYTHMHTTNITFLLTINDNSHNSFNCLQLCNMWGSYSTTQLQLHFYMCGTTRKLQRLPVTCLRGQCFLVAFNAYVMCGNTCGTKFTRMEQKIHTHTLTLVGLLTRYHSKRIQYC